MGRNSGSVATGSARALAAALAALVPLMSGCSLLTANALHGAGAPQIMSVSSPVFSRDAKLPKLYTCRGAGLSPPLQWSGAPQRTRSFAIVLDDSDAPITPYIYWIVYDISPDTAGIAQNVPPHGAVQGVNSTGHAGYTPPCPPIGGTHMYRFTVYALNTPKLVLRPGAGLRAVWSAIAAHVIGVGRLTGTAGE